MSFFQQLRDALRGQTEDFFRVSPRAIAVILAVIALLIFNVYWRTTHAISGYSGAGWLVRDVLSVVVLALLFGARRFFRP